MGAGGWSIPARRPWGGVTARTNERGLDPDDSVPRINWGRYYESGGRLKLNISLELNHRLLDGVHAERSAVSKYVLCRRFEPLGK